MDVNAGLLTEGIELPELARRVYGQMCPSQAEIFCLLMLKPSGSDYRHYLSYYRDLLPHWLLGISRGKFSLCKHVRAKGDYSGKLQAFAPLRFKGSG